MQQPSRLFLRQATRLFPQEEERSSFIDSFLNPHELKTALVWTKNIPSDLPFETQTISHPPFSFANLASGSPGKSQWHQEGYFYCMDYSSLFAAGILTGISNKPATILDMCASPGGKGIVAWRLFSPEKIYFNEVIGKRHAALVSNLKRCDIQSAQLARLDSKIWAQKNPEEFNLVIVDAPCSGQSLLIKGIDAKGCFHPQLIKRNANRQKRILANSAKTVAQSGYLAYMTCTYAEEENESVIEWLLKRFPDFEAISVPGYEPYQSHLADFFCYRFWPQSGLGAGSFACLLRRKN